MQVCLQGIREKLPAYAMLCRRWKLAPGQTAALGDDEPDVPMLEAAGFSACPSDATPPARAAAQLRLTRPGGRGAAREFIDAVLRKNAARAARPRRAVRRRRVS